MRIFFVLMLVFLTGLFGKTNGQELANPDSLFLKDWQIIDSILLQKDQVKTALEKLEQLQKKMVHARKEDQHIKSLLYRFYLEDRLQEGQEEAPILSLENEIKKSSSHIEKAILHSIVAKRYLTYFLLNSWRIHQIRKTNSEDQASMKTWSASSFQEKIETHFKTALSYAAELQNYPMDAYSALVVKGNRPQLRPSLFDLVAHEALDFYTNFENLSFQTGYQPKPSMLKNSGILAPAQALVDFPFQVKDSAAPSSQALKIFQALLRFHLAKKNIPALIATDLKRMEWAYQEGLFPNKTLHYQQALSSLTDSYPSHEETVAVWTKLANIYLEKAQQYHPIYQKEDRYSAVKAKEILEKALTHYPANHIPSNEIRLLLNSIQTKALASSSEKTIIPNQAFPVLITYQNISQLFCRIIKISNQVSFINQRWNPNFWDSVLQISPFATDQFVLPNPQDFQSHSVEVKIEGLPTGEYALLFSDDKAFHKSNLLAIETLQSSMISLVKNGTDLFVLNRANGHPIPNATIEIYQENWNSIKAKTLVKKVKSNSNGLAQVPELKNNSSFHFEITVGKDHLNHQSVYHYGFNNAPKENLSNTDLLKREQRIYFFTDRKIYRPAQDLYFKGILITQDPNSKKPILGKLKDSLLIFLMSPTHKKLDSLKVITNQFGSFSGKFFLPKNELSGNYRIAAYDILSQDGHVKIEEYKRPKFQINFEPLTSPHQLGDEIILQGQAKAFAGHAITGSKISYQIFREALYYPIFQNKAHTTHAFERKEISNGTTLTNQQGQFSIPFVPVSDDIIDSSLESPFGFTVQVTITDLAGETQTANFLTHIGYQTLKIHYQLPSAIEKSAAHPFPISVRNLDGQLVSQKVQISIHQLNSPRQLYLKKIWNRPDQFIYDKDSYHQFFPYLEYNNETDPSSWSIAQKIGDTSFLSSSGFASVAQLPPLKVGAYVISFKTFENNGQSIEKKAYLFVNDTKQLETAVPSVHFFTTDKTKGQPRDTISLTSGSSIKDPYLIQFKNPIAHSPFQYEYQYLKKESIQKKYLIHESDRGNIAFTEFMVFQNRFFFQQQPIQIDFSNKKLNIHYQSFRNKTEPGSKETWTVQVKHLLNPSTATELLTGMYDASLDQFAANQWEFPKIWKQQTFNTVSLKENDHFFGLSHSFENDQPFINLETFYPRHPYLVSNAYELFTEQVQLTPSPRLSNRLSDLPLTETVVTKGKSAKVLNGVIKEESYDKVFTPVISVDSSIGEIITDGRAFPTPSQNANSVITRKQFGETAFFFPQLQTDSLGTIVFHFTMPESLTAWKWMSLAHSQDLDFGTEMAQIVSQKQLMVQPNVPRFLREGDKIELTSKLVNLTAKPLTGQVILELIDASNLQSVDGWFQNVFPVQYFSIAAGESFTAKFPIQVPFSFNRPLTYRFKAISDQYSDGEENTIPIITNRSLVTEAIPFYINHPQKKEVLFPSLLNNQSETLTHQSFTIEFTANPIWYAINAIPYLLSSPYESAEQSFSQLFANLLASKIVHANPSIEKYIAQWSKDSSLAISPLAKNEDLKQSILAETPWVLTAQTETEAAKQLAHVLDPNELSKQTDLYFKQLTALQLPSGGFPWISGGREDRFMTNYMMSGMGKLKRLGALNPQISLLNRNWMAKAIQYLDQSFFEEYTLLKKSKTDLANYEISNAQLDYLYMRSFYQDISLFNSEAHQYWLGQAKKHWIKLNLYQRAKLGIVLIRNREETFSKETLFKSILENAIIDSSKGMYWKKTYTQYWYQSPIEFQSMIIGFLAELQLNHPSPILSQSINQAKTWLILNKQSNHWGNNMATAEACYALLMEGEKWADQAQSYLLVSDNQPLPSNAKENPVGYLKKMLPAKQVKESLGKLTIQPLNSSTANQMAWGAMYWQYFEENEKLKNTHGPLSIQKELYLEKNEGNGKILAPIKEEDELLVGNKVMVRLIINSLHDLDYVHLKDMRASNMEPSQVLSGYRWANGLVYYESTKDVSSNYFIEHLPKGTFIIEYSVFITHAGKCSVGTASIQSMYAPEFIGHSKGFSFRATE